MKEQRETQEIAGGRSSWDWQIEQKAKRHGETSFQMSKSPLVQQPMKSSH